MLDCDIQAKILSSSLVENFNMACTLMDILNGLFGEVYFLSIVRYDQRRKKNLQRIPADMHGSREQQ